jgi:hypothetical protein
MPRVEFEATTTVFERAKTVHALDRAATVIGALKLKAIEKRKQSDVRKFGQCVILADFPYFEKITGGLLSVRLSVRLCMPPLFFGSLYGPCRIKGK